MFESESDKKCENKYNIDNIRPYPICLHPPSDIHGNQADKLTPFCTLFYYNLNPSFLFGFGRQVLLGGRPDTTESRAGVFLLCQRSKQPYQPTIQISNTNRKAAFTSAPSQPSFSRAVRGTFSSLVPLLLGPAPFPDQQVLYCSLHCCGMWPPKGTFLVPRPPGSGRGGKRMVSQ